MKLPAALLLVALLSGCFSDGNSKQESGESESSTQSTTQAPEPELIPLEPNTNETAPRALNLDQCTGWDAFWQTLPPTMVPSDNTPPGWERGPASTGLSGTGITVLQCQKIGVGPIERGPIILMLDLHWNIDVPAKCAEDTQGSASYTVLAKLYASDLEVAEYLASTYGMPTGIVSISNTTEALGPTHVHTVRWTADNGGESELTLLDDSTSVVRPFLYRMFWARGNQLIRWQMDLEMDGPDFSNRQGWGTVQEPLLMARISKEFAGTADWFDSISGPHTVLAYNDFGCEEPIEPS